VHGTYSENILECRLKKVSELLLRYELEKRRFERVSASDIANELHKLLFMPSSWSRGKAKVFLKRIFTWREL
jgi:hypothetical protein